LAVSSQRIQESQEQRPGKTRTHTRQHRNPPLQAIGSNCGKCIKAWATEQSSELVASLLSQKSVNEVVGFFV
jgi:hypothetical protein